MPVVLVIREHIVVYKCSTYPAQTQWSHWKLSIEERPRSSLTGTACDGFWFGRLSVHKQWGDFTIVFSAYDAPITALRKSLTIWTLRLCFCGLR